MKSGTEFLDLARHAVTLPGWGWMPGIYWFNDPDKPIRNDGDEGRHEDGYPPPRYGLPDFSDPATIGCLLALVRGHLRDPNAYVEPVGDAGMWAVRWRLAHLPNVPVSIIGGSEVGALVHALGWVNA